MHTAPLDAKRAFMASKGLGREAQDLALELVGLGDPDGAARESGSAATKQTYATEFRVQECAPTPAPAADTVTIERAQSVLQSDGAQSEGWTAVRLARWSLEDITSQVAVSWIVLRLPLVTLVRARQSSTKLHGWVKLATEELLDSHVGTQQFSSMMPLENTDPLYMLHCLQHKQLRPMTYARIQRYPSSTIYQYMQL